MKKIILLLLAGIGWMQLFSQGSFKITDGTTVTTNDGAFIVADNTDIINNGTLTQQRHDGVFKFTGDMSTRLSGGGITIFDRMILEKDASSQLMLQANLRIAREVVFSGGVLNLGHNVLDLGNEGRLTGESEKTSAFTTGNGYIQVATNLDAPFAANPGNLGAIISSAAYLGNTIIRRGNTLTLNGASNSILVMDVSSKKFRTASMKRSATRKKADITSRRGASRFFIRMTLNHTNFVIPF